MLDDVEQKIMELLKEGEKSTTEISNNLHRNFYDTNQFLEELEKENKIQKIELNKFTFWKIKED